MTPEQERDRQITRRWRREIWVYDRAHGRAGDLFGMTADEWTRYVCWEKAGHDVEDAEALFTSERESR